jgi:hypothetical protein
MLDKLTETLNATNVTKAKNMEVTVCSKYKNRTEKKSELKGGENALHSTVSLPL